MSIATAGGALTALALVLVVAGLAARQARRVSQGLLLAGQLAVVTALVLLAYALLSGDFRLDYVVRETSSSLPTPYKLAALWAGQEGTILLWAAFVLSIGMTLREQEAGRRRLASDLMLGLGAGLLVLLLIKSPFAAFAGKPPKDGQGLNPLLQNPWMMIHPPVLFIGYSLLLAPCALALAGLWQRDAGSWVEPARRYALWGWVFLGAGMMLGAYWAYITLGWGGFWAWDPVENASLVPWLAATALLHGLSLQRRAGALARFNYVAALLTLGAVLYGSYLTRSGVLTGFSVHSFEKVGRGYNAAWLTLLAAPLVTGVVLLAVRPKGESRPLPADGAYVFQGSWVVALMAALVCVGMSMPLLSQLGGGKGQAVSTGFYNQTQCLLFAACAVLMLLQGRQRGPVWIVAGIVGLAAAWVMVRLVGPEYGHWVKVGLVLTAAVAGVLLVTSGDRVRRLLAAQAWRASGAPLAHAGLALLVLGAIYSGPGERSQRLELRPGDSGDTPWGRVALDDLSQTPDDKVALTLSLDGASGQALMYESNQGEMRSPVLFHRVWGDVYLEPEELGDPDLVIVTLYQPQTFKDLTITFGGFDRDQNHGQEEAETRVGVSLKVERDGQATIIAPAVVVTDEGLQPQPVECGNDIISLERISVESHQAELRVVEKDKAGAEPNGVRLALRVTRKPAIGFVWLGTLLLLGGGLLSLRRLRVEAAAA